MNKKYEYKIVLKVDMIWMAGKNEMRKRRVSKYVHMDQQDYCVVKILCEAEYIHRKKGFSIFPSPAGMSLTKLSLGENNDVIYKFPPRESLVSNIPAGDGNIEKLFSRCI